MVKLILGKYVKELINAILAGLMISLGSIVYISCTAMGQKIVGAFMFSVGLLLIVMYGYSLVTGKLGYVFENKPMYLVDCVVSIIGNYIGTFCAAGLFSLTKFCDSSYEQFSSSFNDSLDSMVSSKLADGRLSLIILGLFCGILVYFAVNTYKKSEMQLARIVTVFVCIALFILCGFEHCVADMFYFNLYAFLHNFSDYGTCLVRLLDVIFGNILGCMFIPGIRILRGKVKSI